MFLYRAAKEGKAITWILTCMNILSGILATFFDVCRKNVVVPFGIPVSSYAISREDVCFSSTISFFERRPGTHYPPWMYSGETTALPFPYHRASRSPK